MGQMKTVTKEMHEEGSIAEEHDEWMTRRVEFMYDYLDFDNDRAQIRRKFCEQMNKKSTIQDIGEKLDEFILTSKAMVMLEGHWDMGKHTLEQPDSATKDKDQTDFDWFEHVAKSFDPNTPSWMDDESQVDKIVTDHHFAAKEILEEVKFKDA